MVAPTRLAADKSLGEHLPVCTRNHRGCLRERKDENGTVHQAEKGKRIALVAAIRLLCFANG